MKQNYQFYQEFLTDLIKETNKVISLIPKENDVSQYHYDIVYTLHQLKEIYSKNKKLEQTLKDALEEKSKLEGRLKSCEGNLDYYIKAHNKLNKKY